MSVKYDASLIIYNSLLKDCIRKYGHVLKYVKIPKMSILVFCTAALPNKCAVLFLMSLYLFSKAVFIPRVWGRIHKLVYYPNKHSKAILSQHSCEKERENPANLTKRQYHLETKNTHNTQDTFHNLLKSMARDSFLLSQIALLLLLHFHKRKEEDTNKSFLRTRCNKCSIAAFETASTN